MSITKEHTELPPAQDDLQRLLQLVDQPVELFVSANGEDVVLPEPVRRILNEAVHAFASGRAVTVSPHRTVMTTQEAAEMLSVTRPTLVRLLEAGEIPYTQPSRHRRVELADLLAYQERLQARRAEALSALAGEKSYQEEPTGFVATR